MTSVRVALPSKGSLSDPMFAFLRECGLSIDRPSARSYSARLRGLEGIEVSFLRAPEIVERILAQAPPRKPSPRRLWIFYFGAVAVASLGTGYALFRPKPEPTGLPKLVPNFPVQEPEDPSTYKWPGQWMAHARALKNRGKNAEAKVWCQKVLDYKSLTPELRAEAQEFMDEIDKH